MPTNAPSLQEGYHWLTADVAAKYLGLGRNLVRMLIRTGRLRSIAVGSGRQRRTTKQWCDDYIERQSRQTALHTSIPPEQGFRPVADDQSPQVRQALAILNQHQQRRSKRTAARKGH